MPSLTLRWKLHRAAVDRAGLQWPFRRGGDRRRLLFITVRDPICQAQLFPFWHHRRELEESHGLEMRELTLERFASGGNPFSVPIDAVSFQTWFDLSPEAMRDLAARLQAAFPGARLAYFDWFAPTDLRYAESLEGMVSAYVKKQVLRDRGRYQSPTLGDTNLTDHYARRYGLDYPSMHFPVPAGFWDSLWLSPHFAFSAEILDRLLAPFPEGPRPIDLHARIATQGDEWYARMRQEALDRALELEPSARVAWRGRVSRREYFRELAASKLCFSPFGYGEVCWRDFEAMAAGALLLKPDMSHLDTYPDSFLPNQTYVPLKWDLSDLHEKVAHYLAREDERVAIARRAFDHLGDYFRRRSFLGDVQPLLGKLRLLGPAGAQPAATVARLP